MSVSRRIFGPDDIAPWLQSTALHILQQKIDAIDIACKGRGWGESQGAPGKTEGAILLLLTTLSDLIDSVPPSKAPQRFGNLAFRDFHAKLLSSSSSLHSFIQLSQEALSHFNSSFGNATRIDYGTGHELEFIAYLACLEDAWETGTESREYEAFRVFVEYINVCRKLQSTYNLEPAGSRGVYGLDDHHHLTYLFGSSQMLHPSAPSPQSLLNPSILISLPSTLLFPSSLRQVHNLKSRAAPFHEHSPVLYSALMTVSGWPKMNLGLKKMYQKEVFSAWPVVQHFHFGDILLWTCAEDCIYGKKGEELPRSLKEETNLDVNGGILPTMDENLKVVNAQTMFPSYGTSAQPGRMGGRSWTVSGSRQGGNRQTMTPLRKVDVDL